MEVSEHQYRSCEARADLFAGVAGVITGSAFAVLLLWSGSDARKVAIEFMLFAIYGAWRAIRAWQKTYVQLSSERLVVFERGQPKYSVELAAVASVRRGSNHTVLLMKDGGEMSISDSDFMFSGEARHFTRALGDRFASGEV